MGWDRGLMRYQGEGISLNSLPKVLTKSGQDKDTESYGQGLAGGKGLRSPTPDCSCVKGS